MVFYYVWNGGVQSLVWVLCVLSASVPWGARAADLEGGGSRTEFVIQGARDTGSEANEALQKGYSLTDTEIQDAAQLAFQAKDFETSATLWMRVLNQCSHPSSEQLRGAVLAVYWSQSYQDRALSLWEALLSMPDPTVDDLWGAMEAYSVRKEAVRVVQLLEQILQHSQCSVLDRYNVAFRYWQWGHRIGRRTLCVGRAFDIWDDLVLQKGLPIQNLRELGELYFNSGKKKEAFQIYDQMVSHADHSLNDLKQVMDRYLDSAGPGSSMSSEHGLKKQWYQRGLALRKLYSFILTS